METLAHPHISLFFRGLRGGGAERVMANLARGFAEAGYRVDLVLTVSEGIYLSQLPPQVRVVDLQGGRFSRSPSSAQASSSSSTVRCLWPLVRYLRRERPGVLLGATHFINEGAIVAQRIAQGLSPSPRPTRVWVAEHTTLSQEARWVEQRSARMAPHTARWLYPWADGIIAVSEEAAQDLAQTTGLPRSRIQVIYNPVITPELFRAAQEPLDHPWFAPGQPPVILGCGRFVAQKNFAILVEAFAQVRRRRSARLLLMGGGRETQALRELGQALGVGDDMLLWDFQPNPYAIMQRSALLVQSSRWEGLPTVLIEALALGLPIVATQCPSGVQEILGGGRYGRLVPVGDRDALAAAMEASLTQGPLAPVPQDWLEPFTLATATRRYCQVLGLPPLDRP